MKKIVFVDDGKEKMIKGDIISEDEFIFKIRTDFSNNPIIIGKRNIVFVRDI